MINYLKISLQKMYKFENFESVRREIVSFNIFIYGTKKKDSLVCSLRSQTWYIIHGKK